MNRNAYKVYAILFGGGQIPEANYVTASLAKGLLKRNEVTVYGIHKSFMGLADLSCYEEFNLEKAEKIEKIPGTYLSTCRKVDPSSDEWFYKIMNNLKKKKIKTIFIIGGDGSSRAARDFKNRAKKEGYEIKIVYIPCTIDGINGSESIGLNSAVSESERQSKLAMINAFATWNPKFKGPRVAVIEIQGRNRNDISINVMHRIINKGIIGKFPLSEINLIFIPTGYTWSFAKLVEDVNSTDKETAIIVSEGAKPQELYWDAIEGKSVGSKLENLIKKSGIREANLQIIGYLSQTNDHTSKKELKKIEEWTSLAIRACDESDESIAVLRCSYTYTYELASLEAFALKNSSEEPVLLSKEEIKEFSVYLP